MSVSISFNQAYVEDEDSLLGAHDLLYDPYDGGRAPFRSERLHRYPDESSTAFTEPYETPGMLNLDWKYIVLLWTFVIRKT